MVLKSRYANIAIPDLSLPAYVFAGARERANLAALIDGRTGEQLTFLELTQHMERLAALLTARGIAPGDRVAILSPNTIWYPVSFFAVATLGAVGIPIHPSSSAEEIAHQLEDSGTKALVTISTLIGLVRPSDATKLAAVIIVDELDRHGVLSDIPGPDSGPPSTNPSKNLIALSYSNAVLSGSSRGVMLTHRNFVANIAQISSTMRLSCVADRFLSASTCPTFDLTITSLALRSGCATVVLPQPEAEEMVHAIQTHRVTRAFIGPTVARALASHAGTNRIGSPSVPRLTISMAEMSESVISAFRGAIGASARFTRHYSLAEMTGTSHAAPDGGQEPLRGKPSPENCIGYALPDTDCRVVRVGSRRDCQPGQPGELWVRGPQVMAGYWNDPGRSAATLTPNGWLRTGVIAVMDSDRIYKIIDKVDNLVRYRGYRVAPAELEERLMAHREIDDAAVVGVPDDTGNEIPRAFVVRRVGSGLTSEQVISLVAASVPPHKKVRDVVFVDQIPRSPMGEVLRRQLRALTA